MVEYYSNDDLRAKAVEAGLRQEGAIQQQFIKELRELLYQLSQDDSTQANWDLVEPDDAAATPSETKQYWQTAAGNNDILDLFTIPINQGAQPIFAALSLRTLSAGPTIAMPVPYVVANKSARSFRETFWLNNKGSDLSAPNALVESAARIISHCLLNGSYQVRLDDRPNIGFIAKSHAERRPIYIPDVRELPDHSFDTITVARSEQTYLGMASVLYLPLSEPTDGSTNSAPIVLVLWSPVPRRWDKLLPKCNKLEQGAFELLSYSSLELALNNRLGWLFTLGLKDETDALRRNMEWQSFMFDLKAWIYSQGDKRFQIQFDNFFHGSFWLLAHLAAGKKDATPVQKWLDDLLRGPRSFAYSLQRKSNWNLDDLTLIMRDPRTELLASVRLDEYRRRYRNGLSHSFFSKISPDARVDLDRKTARYIAAAPASNIVRYAGGLDTITFTITDSYITIQYLQKPAQTRNRPLVGDKAAFERYYAIRRGLRVPRSDGDQGGGFGLWLFRILANRAGIFHMLTASPDNTQYYTEIAVPYFGEER